MSGNLAGLHTHLDTQVSVSFFGISFPFYFISPSLSSFYMDRSSGWLWTILCWLPLVNISVLGLYWHFLLSQHHNFFLFIFSGHQHDFTLTFFGSCLEVQLPLVNVYFLGGNLLTFSFITTSLLCIFLFTGHREKFAVLLTLFQHTYLCYCGTCLLSSLFYHTFFQKNANIYINLAHILL